MSTHVPTVVTSENAPVVCTDAIRALVLDVRVWMMTPSALSGTSPKWAGEASANLGEEVQVEEVMA